MHSTRIKICCIESIAEAELAIQAGAGAVGLVSEMPSGPGPIPDHLIAEIAGVIPPDIDSFLLTSHQDAASIAAQLRRFSVTTVQICDRLLNGSYDQLRDEAPEVRIVQVIHVTGEEALHEVQQVHGSVDAVLLDSGDPSEPVKRLGGTGRVHDWAISRRIRDLFEIPIYLAGGLGPDNVAEAVQRVRPYAVDVCSGVRTNGSLDEKKLHAFIKSVRNVDIASHHA